jgi:hypothetical protein
MCRTRSVDLWRIRFLFGTGPEAEPKQSPCLHPSGVRSQKAGFRRLQHITLHVVQLASLNAKPPVMSEINPLDVLAIKNIVSRYCQALDLKDFDLLGKVFTSDVDANYPFNNNLKSLEELKEAIKNR